ncbi:hypothetical protein ACFQ0O_08540 [Saccharopolyspora spinosporotrichia]
MNPPMPVPTVGLLEDLRHRFFEVCLRIFGVHPGLVVEECRAGYARDRQQHSQRVLRLESGDDLGLYFRPCALKARNFFR